MYIRLDLSQDANFEKSPIVRDHSDKRGAREGCRSYHLDPHASKNHTCLEGKTYGGRSFGAIGRMSINDAKDTSRWSTEARQIAVQPAHF